MKLWRYLCRCGDRGALNGWNELVKALIVKQLAALHNDTFPACVAIACNCMVFSFLGEQLVWFMWLLHFWIQIKLSHYVPFDDAVHLTTIAGEKRESRMWHKKKQCVGKIVRLRKCYVRGNHWKWDDCVFLSHGHCDVMLQLWESSRRYFRLCIVFNDQNAFVFANVNNSQNMFKCPSFKWKSLNYTNRRSEKVDTHLKRKQIGKLPLSFNSSNATSLVHRSADSRTHTQRLATRMQQWQFLFFGFHGFFSELFFARDTISK